MTRFMLSVALNCQAHDLAQVTQVLADLDKIGQIEDVSMHAVPEMVGLAVHQQGTGTDGLAAFTSTATGAVSTANVVTMPVTRTRRRAATMNPAGTAPAPAGEPTGTPGSAGSATSEATSGHVAAAPAVDAGAVGHETGGTAPLPTASAATGAAGAVPPANEPKIPTVEEIRVWCSQAVLADGARRVRLSAMLKERGVQTVSDLAEDKRAEFFAAVKEEFK